MRIVKLVIAACFIFVSIHTLAGGTGGDKEPEKGLLYAHASEDGKKLNEVQIDGPPVFNGLAAAQGKLFVSTRNGKLICLGEN